MVLLVIGNIGRSIIDIKRRRFYNSVVVAHTARLRRVRLCSARIMFGHSVGTLYASAEASARLARLSTDRSSGIIIRKERTNDYLAPSRGRRRWRRRAMVQLETAPEQLTFAAGRPTALPPSQITPVPDRRAVDTARPSASRPCAHLAIGHSTRNLPRAIHSNRGYSCLRTTTRNDVSPARIFSARLTSAITSPPATADQKPSTVN